MQMAPAQAATSQLLGQASLFSERATPSFSQKVQEANAQARKATEAITQQAAMQLAPPAPSGYNSKGSLLGGGGSAGGLLNVTV